MKKELKLDEDLKTVLIDDIEKETRITPDVKIDIYRQVILFFETEIKKNTPRYRNRLYRSIRSKLLKFTKDKLKFEVSSKGIDYAYRMEYGSEPFEIENFNSLKKWVFDKIVKKGRVKGFIAQLKSRDEQAAKIAYFIKRKFKNEGMKGRYFFKKAFNRNNINKATRRIKNILGRKRKK